MKIDLPLSLSAGGTKCVSAELLNIAGHLAHVATFAVHRALATEAIFGEWSVSNVETGHRVSMAGNRRRAVELATDRLSTKSVRETLRALKRAGKEITQ